MKQHSKRLLSVLLALALVLSLFPGVALTASAADDIEFVQYRYYTLNTANMTVSAAVSSTTDYTLVSASDASKTWNDGWHVVNGDVVIDGELDLIGTVSLILCDGASLTVTKGIYSYMDGTKLIIYPGVMSSSTRSGPEIQGTGALITAGSFGGSAMGHQYSLEIHGGVIEATGDRNAAGIGGASGNDGCDVVIYDGTVNATGGELAAGIGGGVTGNGGNVEIYGGTVNAAGGGNEAVGIGAGAGGSDQGTLSLYNTELSVSNDGETWTPASDSSVRGQYMQVRTIDPNASVSADAGYTEDFEGENTWTLQNGGLPNAWYVGEAVSKDGNRALYISNDGGVSNSYTLSGSSSFVFAEKRFRFEGGYYDFAYDWRNKGEGGCDYIRVALIPESAEVRPGTSPYTFGSTLLPDGWIALDGGSQLSGQNDWQHMSVVGQLVPEGVYRVAFLWRNDGSAGTQPPAAIDNFSVAVSDYEPPAAVSADAGYTDGFEGENTWILQNGDRTNAWVVGEAVNNGGSKALYISEDGGASNAYNNRSSAFVFAEKRFSFEGGIYNFEYDWRGYGESSYDFLRVALIPETSTLTAGESNPPYFGTNSLPSGWIAIDGGRLNQNNEWQHASYENVEVQAGVYWVAFVWRNDGSGGSNPPAAVDNFSIVNPNAPIPADGIARNLTTNAVYSDLQTAFDAAGAGDVIQLLNNVVLDATVNVPRTLTLDLNGRSVTVDSAAACTAFKFQGTDDYITFTLDDSSDAVYYYYIDETTHLGVVAPEEEAAAHELNGSFTGGYITGGVASVYDNSDPTWPRKGGGAIQALGKSDLVLKNGAIIGNQANADPSGRGACSGGGVYLEYDSVFYMEGGAIIGNTSTKTGGGVKLNSCARNNGVSRPSGVNCGMYISGGVIKHNGVGAITTSYDGGAGIHMSTSELYLRDGSYYIFDNYTYSEDGTKRQSNVLVYNSIGFALEDTTVAPVFGEGTKIGVSRGSFDGKGQISTYLNRQDPAPQQVIQGVMEADDETLMVSIRPADGSLPYQLELVDRPVREVVSSSSLWSWEGTEPTVILTLEWSDGELEKLSMEVTPSEADGVITYTATAEKDGTTYTHVKTVVRSYTVTVEGGSITSGEKNGYSYGDKITVTAGPAPDGKAFAGWYIGEDLVSTSEVYGRAVDRDLALVARYDDQPVVVRPTVTASNTQRTASGDGYKTTLTVSWSVPEGFTMVEAGIYRAYANKQPSQATLVSKGTKKASTLKKANGTYNLSLTIGAAKKNYSLYYVGYVTYKNARGETLTEYSTIGCSAPVE